MSGVEFLHVLAGVAQDTPAPGDKGALYAALSAVAVSMIGGVVAIVTSARNKPEPPQPHVRYVDPPTSNALPQALAELYEDAIKEKAEVERIAALWESRARRLGWTNE